MTATIAYIPSNLSSILADLKVVQIKVSAYAPDTLGGLRQTNHWVFYLAIS
jgi:hypothetical protein